jgi:hypothetical protein
MDRRLMELVDKFDVSTYRSERTEKGKYQLKGWAGHYNDGGNEQGFWVRQDITKSFDAKNDKEAEKTAKKLIIEFLEANPKYVPDVDKVPQGYHQDEENTFYFRLFRVCWAMEYEHPTETILAKPAIPAKEEVPAKPARLKCRT